MQTTIQNGSSRRRPFNPRPTKVSPRSVNCRGRGHDPSMEDRDVCNLEPPPDDRNSLAPVAVGALLGLLINALAVVFCHWLPF
jgi:hypothetical protein